MSSHVENTTSCTSCWKHHPSVNHLKKCKKSWNFVSNLFFSHGTIFDDKVVTLKEISPDWNEVKCWTVGIVPENHPVNENLLRKQRCFDLKWSRNHLRIPLPLTYTASSWVLKKQSSIRLFFFVLIPSPLAFHVKIFTQRMYVGLSVSSVSAWNQNWSIFSKTFKLIVTTERLWYAELAMVMPSTVTFTACLMLIGL